MVDGVALALVENTTTLLMPWQLLWRRSLQQAPTRIRSMFIEYKGRMKKVEAEQREANSSRIKSQHATVGSRDK